MLDSVALSEMKEKESRHLKGKCIGCFIFVMSQYHSQGVDQNITGTTLSICKGAIYKIKIKMNVM